MEQTELDFAAKRGLARFRVPLVPLRTQLACLAMLMSVFLPTLERADSRPESLAVTYLGNEGFLVRSGSQAVLFDALFGAGLPEYDRVPAATVRDMEAGRSLFSHIEVVFISHVHPDHFELSSTLRFLKTHSAAVVVAPVQVSERLRKALAGDPRALAQIRTAASNQGKLRMEDAGRIQFGSFPLRHGPVQNDAYIVVLNGRVILHLGDADLPLSGLAGAGLPHSVDLVFIPFWQLTENPLQVKASIHPQVVVPMHVIAVARTEASKAYLQHVGGRSGMVGRIHSEFSNAAFFSVPLQAKSF